MKLRNELKKFSERVDDIFLFGSVARGKRNPSDTDVLIIFKDVVDKEVERDIRLVLERHTTNISIISKTYKNVFDSSFDARESLLFESVSLLTGQKYSDRFGFSSKVMFKHSVENLSNVERTKFYYALNGRGSSKGIVSTLGVLRLSRGVFLVDLKHSDEFKSFLDSWNIDCTKIPFLIPSRLNKTKFLG